MNYETVTLFLALLAIVAQVVVIVAVIIYVWGRFAPGVRAHGRDLARSIRPAALWLAAAVAATCLAGSLYFSEVADFPPCRLCWYQRIGMYPLAPLLALAAFRRDRGIRPYALTLTVLGGAISVYHALLERFPSLETTACEVTNPCTIIWTNRFGYLTIPTMALTGFALISVLVLIAGGPGRSTPLEATP